MQFLCDNLWAKINVFWKLRHLLARVRYFNLTKKWGGGWGSPTWLVRWLRYHIDCYWMASVVHTYFLAENVTILIVIQRLLHCNLFCKKVLPNRWQNTHGNNQNIRSWLVIFIAHLKNHSQHTLRRKSICPFAVYSYK